MSLLARILPPALLAAALLAGCGSDQSNETTAPAQSGSETTQAQESGSGPVGVRARSCGDGKVQQLRVVGIDCGSGAKVAAAWNGDPSCRPPQGQSRSACAAGEYRCLAAAVDRGLSVTCARRGRTIAFIARPD